MFKHSIYKVEKDGKEIAVGLVLTPLDENGNEGTELIILFSPEELEKLYDEKTKTFSDEAIANCEKIYKQKML